MSSRLARDSRGRLVVEITGPCGGDRFLVLGNTVEAGGTRIGFLGAASGRSPEPQERATRPGGHAGTRRETWPADYPDRARELHATGVSCPKVADELGVPFGTAKSWIWSPGTTTTSP